MQQLAATLSLSLSLSLSLIGASFYTTRNFMFYSGSWLFNTLPHQRMSDLFKLKHLQSKYSDFNRNNRFYPPNYIFFFSAKTVLFKIVKPLCKFGNQSPIWYRYPNRGIVEALDESKLKASADNKIISTQKSKFVLGRVENIAEKGRLPTFSPFSTVFSKAFLSRGGKSRDCAVKG